MLYFIAAYGVRMSKTVMEQPAEAWYENTYVPIPLSAASRNPTTTANFQVPHHITDYPPTDFDILDVPQYRGDGIDFTDPAQWNGTGLDPNNAQAGKSFFIHIK